MGPGREGFGLRCIRLTLRLADQPEKGRLRLAGMFFSVTIDGHITAALQAPFAKAIQSCYGSAAPRK